jgi:hypothetical protein
MIFYISYLDERIKKDLNASLVTMVKFWLHRTTSPFWWLGLLLLSREKNEEY